MTNTQNLKAKNQLKLWLDDEDFDWLCWFASRNGKLPLAGAVRKLIATVREQAQSQ